ncbi:hypothetical protein ACFVUW_30100 [Streptomyces xiamenensis]|uniref:hypothetical protein n=1 Tax=Streptomyces xiamenensis TaxID=408015 RepID=UPI0036E202B4
MSGQDQAVPHPVTRAALCDGVEAAVAEMSFVAGQLATSEPEHAQRLMATAERLHGLLHPDAAPA